MTALRIAHGDAVPGVDVVVFDEPDDTRLIAALAGCAERGTTVIARVADGDAAARAAVLRDLADERRIAVTIAHVEGDDLAARLGEVRPFLGPMPAEPTSVRVELGAWGIVEALDRGAEVVVVGNVSPASLVVAPAARHHGWTREDWDEIAGAVVAGQVLAGGVRATGADFAFFESVPDGDPPGAPIAEIHPDGSAVITKAPGTGGVVSAGTVLAQLLDGTRGLEHAEPDATVRRNSIRVEQEGPDRVLLHSVRGLPGPETAAVGLAAPGGYRTTVTVVLTGVDLDAKTDRVQDALWARVAGGSDRFASVEVQLRPIDDAEAELRITVASLDPARVGQAFVDAATHAAETCPGAFVAPGPPPARPFWTTWPATVPTDQVDHVAVVGDDRVAIAPAPTKPPALQRRTPSTARREPSTRKVAPSVSTHPETISTLLEDLNRRRLTAGAADDDSVHWDSLPMAHVALGRLAGARSGVAASSAASGTDATIGIWVPDEDAYDWLQWYLSVDRFQGLLPADLEGLELERSELPNLNALSFVILDLFPGGVDASARPDPSARSLGEHVRAQVVDIPRMLL